ncbi:MAG: hypothetical protein ACYTGB_06615 [Planctomycetota bacterium]|jgi:hypothetical protein
MKARFASVLGAAALLAAAAAAAGEPAAEAETRPRFKVGDKSVHARQ